MASVVVGRAVAVGLCAGLLLAAPPRARCEDAGMHAYVDPATGALTSTPPPDAVPPPAPAAVAPAAAEDVRAPAPGGGMMIDTRGRFDQAMTATVGPAGELHTSCGTPPASDR
jgi:hypothetical protein